MADDMTLAEEMAVAAGIERLFRRRRQKTLLGLDRRLGLLVLLGAGLALTFVIGFFQERRGKGRQYSAEYPGLAA